RKYGWTLNDGSGNYLNWYTTITIEVCEYNHLLSFAGTNYLNENRLYVVVIDKLIQPGPHML
ncbi:MAG: hypothetical protein L0H53_06270, partial [Candidatus Nitrosocosmicus sp.]|nr:hypothetical protein [Candidatus Nitrosocosmicus sp.]